MAYNILYIVILLKNLCYWNEWLSNRCYCVLQVWLRSCSAVVSEGHVCGWWSIRWTVSSLGSRSCLWRANRRGFSKPSWPSRALKVGRSGVWRLLSFDHLNWDVWRSDLLVKVFRVSQNVIFSVSCVQVWGHSTPVSPPPWSAPFLLTEHCSWVTRPAGSSWWSSLTARICTAHIKERWTGSKVLQPYNLIKTPVDALKLIVCGIWFLPFPAFLKTETDTLNLFWNCRKTPLTWCLHLKLWYSFIF